MPKRLTKNTTQTIGGAIALIVLMCAGMFLYGRWDLKRFKESLKELHEVSPMTISQTEKVANTHFKEAAPAEITAPKPLTQPHSADPGPKEPEMEALSIEILDALMDELFSSEMEHSETEAAGVQRGSLEEEEIPRANELQEEVDSASGFASLISALESANDIGEGSSTDVTIVVQMLKRSERGPVAVDDLITMMEAWLRIQPNAPPVPPEVNETRDFLTNMLSRLRADKEESLQSGKKKTYTLHVY